MNCIIVIVLLATLSTVAEALRVRARVRYASYRYFSYHSYYETSLSDGAIAGIVIGVLAAVAVFCIILIWCVRMRRRQQAGRVIVRMAGVRTKQTIASLSTAPSREITITGILPPPPSYSDVTSEGNVKLGFSDNSKQNGYMAPTASS